MDNQGTTGFDLAFDGWKYEERFFDQSKIKMGTKLKAKKSRIDLLTEKCWYISISADLHVLMNKGVSF